VDLGCGEGIVAGELAHRLGTEFEYRGFDLSHESIDVARTLNRTHPNLTFERTDLLVREPDAGWADLALCLEVLEHLETPEQGLRRIVAWTRHAALVSVPWEPWFQLGNLVRGRHVLRLGNHPEHLHRFRPRTFRSLLALSRGQIHIETCFPWLIGTVQVGDSGSG
jgi:2-polyprenyl-3-methyl-5-hydroxy-6-metoxy-1,4-benzoquinol methylase